MNHDLRQSKYEEQVGNYGGVIIEPYRGTLLAPIRSRPARRGLAHLRALPAYEDDVPHHSISSTMARLFGCALGRFLKLWMLPPFLVTLFFEARVQPPYSHCMLVETACRQLLSHPPYALWDYGNFAGPKLLLVLAAVLLVGGALASSLQRMRQRRQVPEQRDRFWFGFAIVVLWTSLALLGYGALLMLDAL